MLNWLFNRQPKIEKRASGSGFTAEIMSARASYVAGRSGIAELTATAQACVSMWEGGFALADIDGTTLLDPASMAMAGRSLALRGDAVFMIREDGLVPVADWDLRTRYGKPSAYRISVSEAGGGRTETVLAGEVLHFRIGCDTVTPWLGSAPLKRSALTAGMLDAVESALSEIMEYAPLGSQIVPFPEARDVDLENMGRGFRGRRGRVLVRESVTVSAAGGPAPQTDWKPADVTPDLQRARMAETLSAAREAICGAFGVLPAIFAGNAQGPLVREAQRHLAQWTLQPIARLMAAEASAKLSTPVAIDTLGPLSAYDAGGRARAVSAAIAAYAQAKEAGIDPNDAMTLLDWSQEAEGVKS
jgi:hypothetical protein